MVSFDGTLLEFLPQLYCCGPVPTALARKHGGQSMGGGGQKDRGSSAYIFRNKIKWRMCGGTSGFVLPSPGERGGAGTRGARGTARSARCAAGVSGTGRRGGVRPLRGASAAGGRGGRRRNLEVVAGVTCWILARRQAPCRYNPRARGVSGWCGTTGGIGGGPAARGGF